MFIAQSVNSRIAHGRARIVDPEHEVVLVTGGASGLGLVIAQMYGMKGGSVAVLDIKDVAQDECEEVFGVGIKYYRGDVGDRAVLQSVKEQIESEVRCLRLYVLRMRRGVWSHMFIWYHWELLLMLITAGNSDYYH